MVRPRKGDVSGVGNQPYGAKAETERATALVPMGGPPDPMAAVVSPDEIPNLSDPSNRPDEPLTAGLPVGPGPGPEILGPAIENDPVRRTLMAMAEAYPSNDVFRLLDMLDIRGR